jgi:hypothetical protein
MTITTRLLIASLCAASLAIAGVSLERVGPRPVNAGSPEPTISGAWSCPHGGGEGWRVWVSVTNPGTDAVEIRMTTSAGGTATSATPTIVEPGTLRYFEVEAPIEGSATAVEYLGGVVVAGSVVVAPDGGLAAAPCSRNPGTLWHTVESSSLRGETAYLVVHNPFAAQAVVDVILTLSTGERPIRPGRLQGVVLGPMAARAFELNNFALGEAALGATIVAPQGRVAAASVVLSPGGARSSLAVPAPATRWLLPGVGRKTDVIVRALPSQDSPVSAELQGEGGGVPAIDLEGVSAATVEAFEVLEAEGGLLVEADGPRPMLAGRRMVLEAPTPAPQQDRAGKEDQDGRAGGKDRQGGRGGKGSGPDRKGGGKKQQEEPPAPPAADLAATEGGPAVADRWVVPPPVSPEGGPSVVLLQNPGDEAVDATVTLLGLAGAGDDPAAVTIPPHSTVGLSVPEGQPVAALVEGPGLVAAQASLSPGAFSVILGVPLL